MIFLRSTVKKKIKASWTQEKVDRVVSEIWTQEEVKRIVAEMTEAIKTSSSKNILMGEINTLINKVIKKHCGG